MTIREALPEDVSLIRDLACQIWPTAYGHILTREQIDYMLNKMYNENTLREQLQNDIEFVIIYDETRPVGFAAFGLEKPGTYKLHKIYVLPSQQGKGTGRFMLDEIEKTIMQRGAISLLLNVNRQNKAKFFYEKLGFTVIKEEDIDIGNGYFMNDYVMEKKLSTES
ncbi:GNAT family N-acetyltransferase [Terrimonas pollutisoli]|uniref:GNAT family N-acetyltransferase n=1 Tax=Terrimonas pollutisoli TaxID=3034147 RepID=UPI0023EDA22A|nr:GNAT family N-acetyltransferase [Terrimonas sp. H1YJ31]